MGNFANRSRANGAFTSQKKNKILANPNDVYGDLFTACPFHFVCRFFSSTSQHFQIFQLDFIYLRRRSHWVSLYALRFRCEKSETLNARLSAIHFANTNLLPQRFCPKRKNKPRRICWALLRLERLPCLYNLHICQSTEIQIKKANFSLQIF